VRLPAKVTAGRLVRIREMNNEKKEKKICMILLLSVCVCVVDAPASMPPASSSLTHVHAGCIVTATKTPTRRMCSYCNQNADHIGSLAGSHILTIYRCSDIPRISSGTRALQPRPFWRCGARTCRRRRPHFIFVSERTIKKHHHHQAVEVVDPKTFRRRSWSTTNRPVSTCRRCRPHKLSKLWIRTAKTFRRRSRCTTNRPVNTCRRHTRCKSRRLGRYNPRSALP